MSRINEAHIAPGWWPYLGIEAYLATGYEGSVFEYTFTLRLGPLSISFDWRPIRRGAD